MRRVSNWREGFSLASRSCWIWQFAGPKSYQAALRFSFVDKIEGRGAWAIERFLEHGVLSPLPGWSLAGYEALNMAFVACHPNFLDSGVLIYLVCRCIYIQITILPCTSSLTAGFWPSTFVRLKVFLSLHSIFTH